MNNQSNKFTAFLAILATPFALGAFILSSQSNDILTFSDPKNNGYVAPRDLNKVIEHSQKSTVTIECNEISQGSGWAINLENETTKSKPSYSTSIVTALHVVKKCLDNRMVSIYLQGEQVPFPGIIENYDKKNDLALIATNAQVKPFELSEWAPIEGYWVMTSGTPEGIAASVTFGHVMNYSENEVFYTAPISSGNSGGPLLDNEGRVVGTITASAVDAEFNIATSLDGMCRQIIKCEGESYWPWN